MLKLYLIITVLTLTSVSSKAFHSQSTTMNTKRSTENISHENADVGKVDVPQLPMSDPTDESIPTLKFGETLRFEELGPIIINSDGSTRRIENWSQLSDKEKEVSWRRISKRNEERRRALLLESEVKSDVNLNSNEEEK
jgi:hypothetical protein